MEVDANEVLENVIADLRGQLELSEVQSRYRKVALESILYATRMRACMICFQLFENEKVICLLRTKCNNLICTGCWRHWVLDQRVLFNRGLPAYKCMFRSCPKLDDSGDSTVGPCGIACETKNDKLLYRIALTRKKLKDRFEAHITPNVFSDVKPVILREMEFPDKRFSD